VVGELKLERAYYYCWECERASVLATGPWEWTPRRSLRRSRALTGTVGALVSFVEGSALLAELAAWAVDAKQVERTAEGLGKRAR